jgi:parallel beta-helix repeat protein
VLALLFLFGVIGPDRWPDGAIFVPRDVATLQSALDGASDGATIVLQTRNEPLAGPVVVDVPNVTIASAGRQAALSADGADPALTIRADGVTVRGVTIASESIGIRVEAARCTIEDVRVEGAPIGIQLTGAQGCAVRRIEIDGGQTGIELASSGGNLFAKVAVRSASESGVKLLGSWGNTLDTVTVSDAPIGISLQRGSSENELRDCRIERAAITGVEFRGAVDNVLVRGSIRETGIGIALGGVTGISVDGCEIVDAAVAGISLEQAIQNQVTGARIDGSQDAGIRLTQSGENALSYNCIAECAGAGIRVDGSHRNLLIGNRVSTSGIGIDAERTSEARILRNTIESSDGIGIRLVGGADNRLLDNRVTGGAWGVVLSDSRENTLLRNRIEAQSTVGLAVVSGSQATRAGENELKGNLAGVLMADASRSEVLNNSIVGNDIGMWLVRSGSEVRIEGNAIDSNRIGLRQTDDADIGAIDTELGDGGEVAEPVLANNRFADSGELDISNETETPIYAGGNWWGDAAISGDTRSAVVSGSVDLEGSAWKGIVAVGTETDLPQELLGRILQHALTAAGFRVIDLIGLGGSERLREALRVEDVDFVWWGTSETILPDGDAIVTTPIPASRRWTAVVPAAAVEPLAESTLSAYAAGLRESGRVLRYAATAAFDNGAAEGFEVAYGLAERVDSVQRTDGLGETETLLKFGAVDMAIVDNLEETLTSSDFVALDDDLGAFESADLLVAVRSDLLDRHPEIGAILTDLGATLTTEAIHDLVSRIRLLQHPVETAAREHLVGHGLLAE